MPEPHFIIAEFTKRQRADETYLLPQITDDHMSPLNAYLPKLIFSAITVRWPFQLNRLYATRVQGMLRICHFKAA